MATLSLSASAESTNEVRIYINPGHGAFTNNDRPMPTMKHGAAGADTAGFYESNTNLWKSFGLLEKLKEYGVPYNTSIPATSGSQTNIRFSRVKNGGVTDGVYDRELSSVREEAETWNADLLISIHSNANTGGDSYSVHTNFNQLLFLYRGYDGQPYNAGSDVMAKACWNHAIKNKHMHWNWLADPTRPYNSKPSDVNAADWPFTGRGYYPSGEDADGNPYWIKGDWDFRSDWGTQGFRVLRGSLPGFLVEGYDHTYSPARHRAMNQDVCRHEGELYARGLNDYFGWGKNDSYGKIYGIVRDQSVTMNDSKYAVIQNPTIDANKTIDQVDNKKPLNNVKVTLYDSNGVEKQSYTTDDEWNGAYIFKNVAPGTYTIKHSLDGYKEVTKTVTVVANETNYIDIDMREVGTNEPVQGHYAYDLKLTKTNDKTYTASFNSTGDMSDAKIILTNSSTKEQIVILTGAIKKGANSVAIDATKLGEGVKYSWSVAFDNPQSTGYELVHSDNSIVYSVADVNARIGLAIDKDQTSPRFGTIYTITGKGQGIQRFNADFSKNGSKVITNYFGLDDPGSTNYYKYMRPSRLQVNDHKVYIANYAGNYKGVWVYDPSSVSASPTNILNDRYERAVDFSGAGANRVMWVYHDQSLKSYNVGESDSWPDNADKPSSTNDVVATKMQNGDGDIIVTKNGIFVAQNRYVGSNISSTPAFLFIDKNSGAELFNSSSISTLSSTHCGGMAITPDLTTFAIVDGQIELQKDPTVLKNNDINVQVYKVAWNGNTPSFTHQYSIPLTGTTTVDQMEFDHAGNLVIASQQKGLLVYAIKNPSRQTTTNGSGIITGVKPEEPAAPLYIVGNSVALGAWNTENAVEVANDGTNYNVTLDETVTAFKISTNKGDEATFNNGNLAASEAITNGGTVNLIADKDAGNIVLPWTGVWNITVAGDLSTLTATTTTPNPDEGPGIGSEPENAPNPDAIPGESEEDEDDQPEGYFAYDLQSSKSGNVYTFSFKSTGARKNGRIVLKNKSTGAETEIKTPIDAGQNNVEINAYDIQKGDYTWSVKLTNNANSTVTQVGNNDDVVSGNGARICLAIDNDQTSKYFGTIYTHTSGSSGGVQKTNPDMTTNGSKFLTGKFAGLRTDGNWSTRLEANSGKLYIAHYDNTNPGVWVYDPSKSQDATKVTISSDISAGVRGVAFNGTGSSRKMYITSYILLHGYNIGASDAGTSTVANNYSNSAGTLQAEGDLLVTEKGFIASQYRYSGGHTDDRPVFVCIDNNGSLVFKSTTIKETLKASERGAMAITTDLKTFAIVDGFESDASGAAIKKDIHVDIFNVTWNGNTPSFNHQYSIPLTGTQYVGQMEFDHAGNLLIASREKGVLKYAVKTSARVTTTNARSEFIISGLGRETAPSNVVATRKCNGEGSNNTAGTVDAEITWNGDAGDYKVFYQTMRRDASGNREYDNNGKWEEAGTATIASGATTGKFTHKNLAAGSDYNRIYNYKVANYYPAASYASTSKYMEISGKGRTVTSAVPTEPVNVTISQPTEEKNGLTLYTFDLKLDIELNKDVFNETLLDDNDELVKATKYVVVVDEATAKALNAATNVNEVGRFYKGPATMTANNCNHYGINDWYMIVDFDDITPTDDLSKATKSITWKNVNPLLTYKPQVYTSAVRTFNFTAADATISGNPDAKELAMTLPVPEWIWGGEEDKNGRAIVGLSQLSGDYSSLVGNEDYPMGVFRKVGDTENATNPISMTKANIIGTAGAMIEPLALTDEVLGYNPETGKYDVNVYRLSYSFDIYKLNSETNQWDLISYYPCDHQGNVSDLYSNTQKRSVDILNFDVDYKEEIGLDGRTRYVYDSEKTPIYKVASIVNYDYLPNGEGTDYRSFYEKEIVIKPNFAAPEIVATSSPGYLFLENSIHWDVNCKDDEGNYINEGYYKWYYDAAMDIHWNDFEDDLVRNIGFHATPKIDCVGHYVKDADGKLSSTWIPYHAASVLTDKEVARYNTGLGENNAPLVPLGYDGTGDWSAIANEEHHIPLKVHYVWAGNDYIPSKADAGFNFELTADYPIYIDRGYGKPAFVVNSYTGEPYNFAPVQTKARSSATGEEIFVISSAWSYNSLTMDGIITNTLTGVEDVCDGDGTLRLFPNPANSVVTLQAPITMTDVKIFSIDGQLVKEFDANDTQVRLNVSDLNTGVYIVHAAGTSTRLIKK